MKLEGYDNYEIYPETGQVWSYTRKKFIGSKNGGYWKVGLTDNNGVGKTFFLHRLIWKIVNGVIPNGMQVNHIDENKDNNSIVNLNLMTPKENTNWGTGTERSSKTRLNLPQMSKSIIGLKDGEIKLYFSSTQEAGRNGFQHSHISKCCKGIHNHHKGYQWQYQDDYLADWWEQEMEKALN